ncbi:hypothetical protein FACS1894109_01260 [Spirochaetia bacterium]|nr:hypothetical protein FACS1894109_01260 [Spirochaetia bacterium]
MASTANRQQNATTIRFDDDYTRHVIDTAAGLLNQTRTGFLLSVARERAEAVIRERAKTMQEIEILILSPEASLDIVTTLENPPKPNKAITKAMRDYKNAKIDHRK